MKGNYFTLVLGTLVALAAVQPNVAQAQAEMPPAFCFTDGFGFVWDVQLTSCSGGNCSLTGTVDIAGACLWGASGTVNRFTGAANLTATNLCPDGCTFYTDSFDYTGTFVPQGGGVYNGSGNWTSYCFGAPLSSGTWTGTAIRGACRAGTPEVTPMNPAVHPNAQASVTTSPEGYGLTSAPNPFSRETSITFVLPEANQVSLRVYDVLGREVATLVNEERGAGTHTVEFDASSLPGGTYVYRIQAGSYSEARQMMVVR
jgi:hypothetical protein